MQKVLRSVGGRFKKRRSSKKRETTNSSLSSMSNSNNVETIDSNNGDVSTTRPSGAARPVEEIVSKTKTPLEEKQVASDSPEGSDQEIGLEDLKASFRQFSTEFDKNKNIPKKDMKRDIISSSSHSKKRESKDLSRDELRQSLHEFQAKMNAKMPPPPTKPTNDDPAKPTASDTIDSPKEETSRLEESNNNSLGGIVPNTFREDSKKKLVGLDFESTASQDTSDRTGDEDTSAGLEPMKEEEASKDRTIIQDEDGQQNDDSRPLTPSFGEDDVPQDVHPAPMDHEHDDLSSDGSIYEELLPALSPARKETTDGSRKKGLSKQDLTQTSHGSLERQDSINSHSSSDSDASLEPPKMQSFFSREPAKIPTLTAAKRSTIQTAKHRASELERQTLEMSKEDLFSTLKAFQTQLDEKLNKGEARPARSRNKEQIGKPKRHKSVDEDKSPVPARRRQRRGSMIEMAKMDSSRSIEKGHDNLISDREREDQNFRKWFESKMEARTGENERFILEEDDHGDGTVKDKSHGPLVVNVLHGGEESSHHHPEAPTDAEDRHEQPIGSAVDRAAQIKQKNNEMSREEIKASLLQFQSELKTRSSAPARPRKPPPPSDVESSEFRPPERPGVHTRLAQIEKRNESLSRDQLTASLLAFKSNIEKKVPTNSSPKEGEKEKSDAEDPTPSRAVPEEKSPEKKPPQPNEKPNNNNNELGDRNNIRRSSVRQDRIRILEAEQATIPRNVMIASLQKFQADIQGKIQEDKPKSTKLENFDAITENTSMEVTEDEFLNKVTDDFLNKVVGKTTTTTADGDHEDGNKTQDTSRQETMKNLLSFQTDMQGRIIEKNCVFPSQTEDGAIVDNDKGANKEEDGEHPQKIVSMLKNLEDLKKRNEEKVSTMQNLDRIRKHNEEKVSAMISALSPEEATEMPPWFAEFAQQQENKFQELVQISEQRNKEIMRLSNAARSQSRSMSSQIDEEKKMDFSQTLDLEQHENLQRNTHTSNGLNRPGGQFMGYPPHEGQSIVDSSKDTSVPICNAETRDMNVKCDEASFFIQRFAQETGLLNLKRLEERVEEVKSSIVQTGSYTQTYDELQYGCRLAWRNCGRFIMRSAYSTLTVRDCRQAKTAEECFNQCVQHLKDVFDDGSQSPIISVFQPKEDGKSAPVRIWNRELLGYAAYKREDGSIMGDASNLDFTALCVSFGWIPPQKKSDFDILPLLISDETRGHDNPKVFDVPQEAIHEVELEHPDFDLFKTLNLRWHAQASDASMGIDIGGLLYQSAPFTRLYQATEISSFLLDRSRYSFAEAIAAACALKKTHLSLWRDDVQLQTQKSILNSFSRHGLRCRDHHSVSEEFLQFYLSEVKDFGNCPADWAHVVAPAASSMTGAYHQQMTNFFVKPQYLDQIPLWDDLDLTMPPPITITAALLRNSFVYQDKKCQYDHVFVYYASETGESLRFATLLVGDFDGRATGPIPLDSLPDLFLESVQKQSLVIIVTSTASSGTPPLHAKNFLGGMSQVRKGSLHSIDFAICALYNSAYIESLASFAFVVEANLKRAGCVPMMGIHYVDSLEHTEGAFTDFRKKLFDESEGILYKQNTEVESTEPKRTQLVTMTFENLVPVLKLDSSHGPGAVEGGNYLDSWERNANALKPSLDLFRFKVEEEDGSQLKGLAAGDHVALYARNMNDVVETVLRHVNTPDDVATKEYLRKSKDLSKPLKFDELSFLRDYVQGNERAMSVLDKILANAGDDSSLSVEQLVQIMPPGSIPIKWILKYVPSMDPRFYSIASVDGRTKTVSIVQSVYTFNGSQKAGVASRWLRSLRKGQKVNATFTTTNFRLPQDNDGAPLVLISAGAGIAPHRTFWLSGNRNPTYLFCGCKSPEELPFSTEIDLLKRKGLLHPFIAYTHGSGHKMELEGLLRQERTTLLDLLHNSRTRLYVCGTHEVDARVRNSLVMILAQGNSRHRGMGMAKAMDQLALMCQTKRFVREVYGSAIGDTRRSDPTYALWQESTVKVVRALTALEKLEVPVAPSRKNIRHKERKKEESLAYNPMISGA